MRAVEDCYQWCGTAERLCEGFYFLIDTISYLLLFIFINYWQKYCKYQNIVSINIIDIAFKELKCCHSIDSFFS